MKIRLVRYLLVPLSAFLATCKSVEQKLDGAYENTSEQMDSSLLYKDTTQTVTLFKSGYWITTTFTKQSVIDCYGGTYKMVDGIYFQKVYFSVSDTSKIGKEYNYKYYSDNKDLIADFIDSDINKKSKEEIVYKQITNSSSLKNASLEGAWSLKLGQGGYNTNNREYIRIYAYPCFAKVIYNYKEKKFIAAYCGVYQFDGENLIEKIQYSLSDIALGSTIEWKVKRLTDKEIQLFDIDSFSDEEIYQRSNNQ